jgi:shikimate 5-dehydrogenase
MHLIALVCQEPSLSGALSAYRDPELNVYFHPLPERSNLTHVAEGLEPLDFAGALILDEALQEQAFALAGRGTLDASEVAAADTLSVAPGGLIAEYNLGRAIGAALQGAGWDARGADVVILGEGAAARAASRELSSLGAVHLAVLAANRPVAEMTPPQLAATTELTARAQGDPVSLRLIERADLLVRITPKVHVPEELLGPHLTVVDLAAEPLSGLRQQALNFGALTVGLRDVQAQQVALALHHLLGAAPPTKRFLELLHAL